MGIEVKIIADSISETGKRITTFQTVFNRYILPEWNTHRTFCLDGDSILEFDLPTRIKGSNHKSYTMKLKDFVNKWHNGVKEHRAGRLEDIPLDNIEHDKIYTAKELSLLLGFSSPSNIRGMCRKGVIKTQNPNKHKSEDHLILGSDFIYVRINKMGKRTFSIKDRLMNMQIRQLDENSGLIRHSNVVDCYFSGVKEVFSVRAGKFHVAGSKDHRILTDSGWKRIEEIQPKVDSIIVQRFGKTDEDKVDPNVHIKINGQWRTTWQRKVFKTVCDSQNNKCFDCQKVEPKDIHHVEPVYKNPELAFELSNVVALCEECHKERHKVQGWQGGNYLYGDAILVDEIVSLGEKETYDLEIAGEFANFLANDVVVHNSRNAASERAVPVNKMIEQVRTNPAMPIHWGKNKPGMQASEEFTGIELEEAKLAWLKAARDASDTAEWMNKIGLHKQVVNRILSPFTWAHVITTATEWDNFFELRDHTDAQPEIRLVAELMKKALNESEPKLLKDDEWHLPYVMDEEKEKYSIEDLIKISAARCARVSYLTHDGKSPIYEDDIKLYERLVGSKPIHASPIEHQAKPAFSEDCQSGNFRGWIQYRKIYEQTAYQLEKR